MKKLIIFGLSELAELAHFYFTNDSNYEIAAFTVDAKYVKESNMKGLPIIPFEDLLESHPASRYEMFVAIGYKDMNSLRKEKYIAAKSLGYSFATYVSSKSEVWKDLSIGENCMVMEGNVIMPFCRIGNNVLVWVNSILAHHSQIEDHVCITSHCAVGGNVNIKEQAFLGLNCTIRHGLTIGRKALIGAGANLITDAKENGVYLGNPAQLSTQRSIDILI